MNVRLADVAEVRTGYSFRGKIDHDPGGRIAVIQMRDIGDAGQVDTKRCIHIKEEPAFRRHLLQPGDVVMQARGSTFPAGTVDASFHGIAAFGLHVLRPSVEVLSPYLAWVLNQSTTQGAINAMTRGTRVPFLSKSNLGDLHIPLPARQTQGQIVEVAQLQQRAAHIAAELQNLRDVYGAAVTWRAATNS